MSENAVSARSVIIHADDIGMCEATVSVLDELMHFGLVSSASLMAPCPWFSAAAEWFRDHPETDVGVHLTLTSEWLHYRWRPLTTLDPASGLLDREGFMPRTRDELQLNARADVALVEARAQVNRVRLSGIQPSHIDAHMFAFSHLFPAEYAGLAAELGVAMLKRPPFVHITGTPNTPPEEHLDAVMKMFTDLPQGLSYIFLHPSRDTPELRSIAPNWRHRVAEWRTFQDPRLKEHIETLEIPIVSYRDLRAKHSPASAASR